MFRLRFYAAMCVLIKRFLRPDSHTPQNHKELSLLLTLSPVPSHSATECIAKIALHFHRVKVLFIYVHFDYFRITYWLYYANIGSKNAHQQNRKKNFPAKGTNFTADGRIYKNAQRTHILWYCIS